MWRPAGQVLEAAAATLGRYALRLIDRSTGKAYSADELASDADSPVKQAIELAQSKPLSYTDADGSTHGSIASNVDGSGSATRNTLGEGAVDFQSKRSGSDDVASGDYSCIPGGANNEASGNYSFAGGASSRAEGTYSIAFGNAAVAKGTNAVALGPASYAQGSNSMAFGSAAQADGVNSFAFGISSYAVHQGASVEKDSINSLVQSAAVNEKTFSYTNGYRFLGGPVRLPIKTVGTLPAAASFTYYECWVSDANSPVVGNTVAAGGAAKAKVASDGTNWKVIAIL